MYFLLTHTLILDADAVELIVEVVYAPVPAANSTPDQTGRNIGIAGLAEVVRAKLGLKAEVRDAVQKWLHVAAPGDTLIMPGTANDEAAIVMLAGPPKISRMTVETVERTETVVNIVGLPSNTKKVTPSSKKKLRRITPSGKEDKK